MKNSRSSAKSSASRFWRPIALLSLVVNAGLILGVWKQQKKPRGVAASDVATAATAPTPVAAEGPYAALGAYIAENNRLAELGWTETEFSEFLAGMRASYEGRGLPLNDDAKKLRDDISARVQSVHAGDPLEQTDEYFRLLREKEGALRTESGLHYRVTEEGTGPQPEPDDVVVLSFSVRQPDGTDRPELSRARARVAVNELLPGLTEGVQLLRVGGKASMILPAHLSFSEADWPQQVPKGLPLTFLVELQEIVDPSPPQ